MKRVFQEIVCNNRGDCQSAAIASLLGLEILAVPKFLANAYDAGQPSEWHSAMITWLRARGLHHRYIAWNCFHDWRGIDGALCIASMPSQKFPGSTHAVIGGWESRPIPENPESTYNRFVVVHDPNPGNAPYPDDIKPIGVAFLIPLDPSAVA